MAVGEFIKPGQDVGFYVGHYAGLGRGYLAHHAGFGCGDAFIDLCGHAGFGCGNDLGHHRLEYFQVFAVKHGVHLPCAISIPLGEVLVNVEERKNHGIVIPW